MFQRALLSSLLLIILSFTAAYWFHVRERVGDDSAYEQLIHENTELRSRHALEGQPAHQDRREVQKDIWSTNDSRHFQIQSNLSELTLWENKEKLEAEEKLQKVRGFIQTGEGPKYTFIADEGIYSYPSQKLIAKKNCSLIQGENHFDGEEVHFDLENEIVTYTHPKGKLNGLDFSAEKLIWDKNKGTLHLSKGVKVEKPNHFTMEGDEGILNLEEFKPQFFVLQGNVKVYLSKIQNQESFAAADKLTYNPNQKTMLLSANKRVLFWQTGLRLSAPEVLIQEDPLSHTEIVQGLGDVHFSFDKEEKNFIEELFNQFL